MTILSRVFSRVPGPVALIALLAVVTMSPASAQQQQNMQKYGEPDKDKTPAEKAAEKEAQRAYERSLGNIPAQQSSDPWGIARDNSTPKAATKTASPKPKAAKNDTKTDSAAKQ
jgi:hypothetical protein